MVDLEPHPLIPAVVAGLGERNVALTPVDQLADLVPPGALSLPATAQKKRGRKQQSAPESPPEPDPNEIVEARARALQLAGSTNLPEFVTLVGFVGATLRRDPAAEALWTVLYLNPQLSSWLLVPTDGIVCRDRITDEKAPYKQRDVIWVTADASVGAGSGSLSVQAQFLTGEFTRAGDYEASPEAAAQAAATGVFCPGGCKGKTVR